MDDNIKKWTVDDVSSWLESIGLGHKKELVHEAKIDGNTLFSATEEDLVSKGFAKLQAKKILRSLEPMKEKLEARNTRSIPSESLQAAKPSATGSTTALVDDALKKEVAELRSLVLSLSSRNEASSRVAPPPHPATGVPPTKVVTVNFCGGSRIEGNETQMIVITMRPGDVVRAEPGAMVYMSSAIEMETKTGGQGLGRLLTGQKIFLTEFQNSAGITGSIAFTPDFPGQIIPIAIEEYGGKVICQKSSLLCYAPSIDLSVEFAESLGAGFFGGEGFILQWLNGHGMAFLNARGVITKKVLAPNETLVVSSGCLVAFEYRVRYTVTTMRGASNILFGGEGLFVTNLTGPGTVWLESHNLSRLFEAFHSAQNRR